MAVQTDQPASSEYASAQANDLFIGIQLARPEGLEPPAYWFEASRSIQLSYGRA
jgi:hypothetical protein